MVNQNNSGKITFKLKKHLAKTHKKGNESEFIYGNLFVIIAVNPEKVKEIFRFKRESVIVFVTCILNMFETSSHTMHRIGPIHLCSWNKKHRISTIYCV